MSTALEPRQGDLAVSDLVRQAIAALPASVRPDSRELPRGLSRAKPTRGDARSHGDLRDAARMLTAALAVIEEIGVATPSRAAVLGGARVDLRVADEAISEIVERASTPGLAPLGVVSVNLDHVHQLTKDPSFAALFPERSTPGEVEWLSLIDGAPIASAAERVTGDPWPRLAGSDLIDPLLESCREAGLRVGIVGGSRETHEQLRARITTTPALSPIVGLWSPDRADLDDPVLAAKLDAEIADARIDVLIVALGKPRQERWITSHGTATGARVLLGFGAVVDFLAGSKHRAPEWIASSGLEWAWRLSHEPKRLARRYLVQGPPAYLALRRHSTVVAEPAASALAASAAR